MKRPDMECARKMAEDCFDDQETINNVLNNWSKSDLIDTDDSKTDERSCENCGGDICEICRGALSNYKYWQPKK